METHLAEIDPKLEWEIGGSFHETMPLAITRGFSDTSADLAET